MIEKVKNAGVVGAGGAGFPTHVKIDADVDTLIANGAECEPLLSTDHYLMVEKAEEIIEGLKKVKKSTGAQKVYFALKKKYKDAIKVLRELLSNEEGIELYLLDNYYPAGDEVELVHNITGRVVPEGGIPLDVSCVVINVNTLLNVHLADKEEKPVTTRWITVAGEVAEPYLAEAPVGISAGQLVDEAKPLTDNYVLISGGPMTGNVVDRDHSIDKTCGGLIVLPEDNNTAIKKSRDISVNYRRGQSMCDQCFECTIVCPRGLLGHDLTPHEIMRSLFISPEQSQVDLTMAYLCCECGLCDLFACPMDLTPRNVLVQLREELQEAGIENPHHRDDTIPHEERDFRRVNTGRMMARLELTQYKLKDFPLKDISTSRVRISLAQHVGAPAQPAVEKGQSVNKGEPIGELPDGALSARVHASIAGKIIEVTDNHIEIQAED
ncbi:MAG: 4Fe-4S dicluster domain-containing protein [bacterium]